jgi:hypothetical protein
VCVGARPFFCSGHDFGKALVQALPEKLGIRQHFSAGHEADPKYPVVAESGDVQSNAVDHRGNRQENLQPRASHVHRHARAAYVRHGRIAHRRQAPGDQALSGDRRQDLDQLGGKIMTQHGRNALGFARPPAHLFHAFDGVGDVAAQQHGNHAHLIAGIGILFFAARRNGHHGAQALCRQIAFGRQVAAHRPAAGRQEDIVDGHVGHVLAYRLALVHGQSGRIHYPVRRDRRIEAGGRLLFEAGGGPFSGCAVGRELAQQLPARIHKLSRHGQFDADLAGALAQ